MSEESENAHTAKQIWGATVATFLAKFLFALTFVIPVLLLSLRNAIIVSIVWGLTILTVLSYAIARSQGKRPWKIVSEHLMIAVLVISITHYVGDVIGKMGR
jgi:VIT1/CCC1 family predicted Fe2+/Mn2+ transporter